MSRHKLGHAAIAALLAVLTVLPVSFGTASAAACDSSLQSLVDQAPAGSVLSVPPCVYREQVTVDKPLTLDGGGAAEIRGSDVWTAWTPRGTRWASQQAVPGLYFFHDSTRCADGTEHCLEPEQVFVDGTPLQRTWSTTPTSGQFTLDNTRHVLLADDPRGHLVEVTTRSAWLYVAADGVTIANMTMRHAASDAQRGAISNWGGPSADVWHSNIVIDHDRLLYSHGYAVGLCCDGQTGVRVTNSEIAYAGQEGLGAYLVPALVVSGNHIHDNSTAAFSCDWDCGGMKLVSLPNVQVLNNEVDHSATGIWTDIGASNGLIQGNNVHDNSRSGIYVEISSNMRISGNTLANNDMGFESGAGIASATSAATEIDHNVLIGNGQAYLGSGISAFYQNRPDAPSGAGIGINIHDNQLIQPLGSFALNWWFDGGTNAVCTPTSNNRGANNWYSYPVPENGDNRFEWCGGYARLVDFQQTAGGQGGGYVSSVQVPAPTGVSPAQSARQSRRPTHQVQR